MWGFVLETRSVLELEFEAQEVLNVTIRRCSRVQNDISQICGEQRVNSHQLRNLCNRRAVAQLEVLEGMIQTQ